MSIRSIICACIGAAVVLFLWALTPHHVSLPKGIVLPASASVALPAITPDQVVIYHQPPSQTYQVVAQIRAEQGFDSPASKTSQDALLQYVKELAASAGANGVVIRVFVPDEGVQKAFTFIGDAIFLQQERNP